MGFLARPPFDFAQDLAREWRRHERAIDHEARVLASRMARTQAFLRQSLSHDTRVSTNEWFPAVHMRNWEGTAPGLGSYTIVPEKRPAID